MLEYERIDVFEEIDVNKTNGLRECIIYHFWCFLEINFKFQPEVCHGCQDLMQKAMIFNDVAVVFVKANDNRIHFLYMSREKS